jgi:acyl-CoA dehydrogenase
VSEVTELLVASVRSLLDRHCPDESLTPSERAGWAADLWSELERADLTRIGVPEDLGGSGGDLEDAAAVVRVAASRSAAVPLAETSLLAGWLLATAGMAVPQGPLTAAVLREGRADRVPYARQAAAIAVLAETAGGWGVGLLRPDEYRLSPGVNLAGEPRDDLLVRHRPELTKVAGVDPQAFLVRGALSRSIQLAGALERVLELALLYAGEREQFSSRLNRFQAVQHLLTTIAEETHATRAAVDGAVAKPDQLNVAIAKVRAGEAAGAAGAAAHQVHGAIGFTDEHVLHHSTRRLWSWRDEFGTEASWAIRIGRLASARGADRFWDLITEEA